MINTAITVNGIIVGKQLGTANSPPGACAADTGWGGVAANTFFPVNSMLPDTHSARLFMAATQSGPNIDKMYLGIHVENDDGFTQNDIVTLYFDGNNNGSFDAPDFALKIELGRPSPPTDEDCAKAIPESQITFYRFSGGTWNPQGLPGGIKGSVSYDYGTAKDPETGIWEAEIEIDPSAVGNAIPVATGLAIGAKLYIEEPANGTLVFDFPLGLTTDDNPNSVSPNDGGVTPAKLAKLTVGSCGLDVVISNISGSAPGTNNTPGTIKRGYPNPIPATGVPESDRNSFTADVQLVNPANAADTSPVAVPDAGNAVFHLLAWNGGFGPDHVVGTKPAQFTAVGQKKTVELKWPATEADYSPLRNEFDVVKVNHACLKINLSGFPVNLNEPGDVVQQNLYFTTASTVKDRFLLAAPRQEGPGGVNLFYLRARWTNVPAERIDLVGRRPRPGMWTVRFPTAARIGLKDRGKGWYSIALKPNEQRLIDIVLTGGAMPHPATRFVVSPRAGGQSAYPASGDKPYTLKVKPGMMVNIVAGGLIYVDPGRKKPASGPDGFFDREMNGEFLLSSKSAYTGREHIGALIGSFDNFRTSFLIGGSSSFIVPDNATDLSLAVNDLAGSFNDNTGRGFTVTAILSPPSDLPTRILAAGNPGNGDPARAALGGDLPRLNIDVLQADERRKGLRPAGYVSYVVYFSHER